MGLTSILGIGSSFNSISGATSTLLSTFGGSMSPWLTQTIDFAMPYLNYMDDKNKNTEIIRDLSIQTRTYGRSIPEVFGKFRIAGNIMWHSSITEKTITKAPKFNKNGSLSSGGQQKIIRASFAIAICKGPIDSIENIYANEEMLNLSKISYVVYNGSEDQAPNSTMQAHLGIENVPAHRGLCYIVFSDFPLEEYGGRVPNFAFDVNNSSIYGVTTNAPEKMVKAINIIPGTGESVYDTIIQKKYHMIDYLNPDGSLQKKIQSDRGFSLNNNSNHEDADFIVSLNNLQKTLPNLEWVSLVVVWFCDNLDLSLSKIYPASESKSHETFPDNWSVAGINRSNGRTVSLDKDNKIRYGGTVSDIAVIRGIEEIKKRGLKVCLYPMIFMDIEGKPWRGKITGKSSDIFNFFNKSDGYNSFIKHYANIAKNRVDAMVIGSELIGITSIIDQNKNFPGVDELVKLAQDVKNIVGSSTKITYAADWSEYHHTKDGYYNMDKLWSSNNIDFIGIDAYFPLTNIKDGDISTDKIISGWSSGEGYDYYYTDSQKENKALLSPQHAWKNMEYFWGNQHVNPDGKKTTWVPKSKPIWFTEYGFPSVNNATNSPNVFYAKDSIDGGFPIHSDGSIDIKIQRDAIFATESKWQNSNFVLNKFLWTWDARPYPFFPGLTNLWSDAENWKYGHFVNGKLGSVGSLKEIVKSLCISAGINESRIDVSSLSGSVNGYIVDTKDTCLSHIKNLSLAYEFGAYIDTGIIVFRMLNDTSIFDIDISDILINPITNKQMLETIIKSESGFYPNKSQLMFFDVNSGYKVSNCSVDISANKLGYEVNNKVQLALGQQEASEIAYQIGLKSKNDTRYSLSIPNDKKINPLDIVRIWDGDEYRAIRVETVSNVDGISLSLFGKSEFIERKKYSSSLADISFNINELNQSDDIDFDLLDIPNISGNISISDFKIHLACHNTNSKSRISEYQIFASYDQEANYSFLGESQKECIFGTVINKVDKPVNHNLIDMNTKIIVHVFDENPPLSVSKDEFLANSNLGIFGNEIISFQSIRSISDRVYEISGLIRGRFGTENQADKHLEGDRFIMLDSNLNTFDISKSMLNKDIYVKVVPSGKSIQECVSKKFTLQGAEGKSFPIIESSYVFKNNKFEIEFTPRPSVEYDFFSNQPKNYSYKIVVNNRYKKPISEIKLSNSYKYIYDESDQVRDFGGLVGEIDFFILESLDL